MSVEKELIQNIFSDRAKQDANTTDLANALSIISDTVFGEANRFIYELLQNADDSCNSPTKSNIAYEVDIILTNNYLIFRHNGEHFNEDDVKTICSIGNKKSGKKTDLEKIGYKGIGFKSIFKISDYVLIKSNGYLFRFDKNYSLWKDNDNYPWQIIPVWSEDKEILSELHPFLNESYVNIIIRIKDVEKVKSDINYTINDAKILLFLNKVKKINYNENGNAFLTLELKDADDNTKQLFKNNNAESSWIYEDNIFDITDTLKNELSKLSDAECPEKLLTSSKTKVTLALQVKNGKIINPENNFLYAYLPTTINKNLPFLINASFLTNAERTNLLENPWNKYLIKCFVESSFLFIKKLSKNNNYKNQILKILRPKFEKSYFGDLDFIEKEYNSALEEMLTKYEFIPQNNSTEFIKISEALLDLSYITEYIGEQALIGYLTNLKLVDTKLENVEVLKKLGAYCFNLSDIFSLNYEIIANPDNKRNISSGLITYFYDYNKSFKQEDVASVKFLLDENNQFCAPKDLYVKPEGNVEAIVGIPDILFINVELQQFIYKDNDIKTWLKEIGLKEPSDKDIFRKSILAMIENNKINIGNAINIARFVLNVYKKGYLTEIDYAKLKNLKVKTQNSSMKKVSDCYLGDIYDPENKLQNILPVDIYLSEDYIGKDYDVAIWKEFFKKLDVDDEISIISSKKISRSDIQNISHSYLQYLDRINENGVIYPGNTARFPYQHGMRYFVFCRYHEYCMLYYDFAKFYWILIFSKWDKIKDYIELCSYYTLISDNPAPSFFRYQVREFRCLPGSDGKLHKSGELYSPSLKNLLLNDYPTLDLNIDLTEEQESFLGLKSNISYDVSIYLLKIISQTEIIESETITRIEGIYKYLLKGINDNRRIINQNIKLLSTQNTFANSNELYCNIVDEIDFEFLSDNILRVPSDFSVEDIKILCGLLSVKLIKYSDLEIISEGITEDPIFINRIKEKIQYIAILEGSKSSTDYEIIGKKIFEDIEKLKFYRCEELEVYYPDNVEIIRKKIKCCYKDNNVYYKGNIESPYTMQNIIKVLIKKLGLKAKTTDILPLFYASSEEISEELEQKGYNGIQLSGINSNSLLLGNNEVLDTVVNTEEENIINLILDTNYYDNDSNLPEYQNIKYFSEQDDKNFGSKLISILNKFPTPWAGYIFHFTGLDNAINILKAKKIYCRNKAKFYNSAGDSFIHGTSDEIKNLVRFYFRPLTPTQYYNEGLGRITKKGDLPQCPVPIFFRFKISDVLAKYNNKCYASNGNLKDYSLYTQYSNTYDFLKTMYFDNLYKTIYEVGDKNEFLRASQQEFVIEEEFDFKDLEYWIICKNEQDKSALLNLLNDSDLENKILIDSAYFYNLNPTININIDDQKELNVKVSPERHQNIDECLILETKDEFVSASGNIKNISRNGIFRLFAQSELKVKYSNNISFTLYYEYNNIKWTIYKYGNQNN